MPSIRKREHPNRPWMARRKRDDIEFCIGYYATKEEAEAAERRFDEKYPPRANQYV